ncbi:MAG: hypothetical protein ACYTFW_00850 [Planctomycetota bacterium]|jgi:hypothetical protein
MADQHNSDIPAMGNQISADIPDIKENLEWHKDVLQMLAGWKAGTIASVGPPNHRATFAYSSTTAISIGTGSYFHDGTTRQTLFWDSAITFTLGSGGSNAASSDLGASEWHYIYIDNSAVVTIGDSEIDNTCFLNSTVAPTWDADKHGWYGGLDMCVFAVLTDGSNNISKFYHDGDYVQFGEHDATSTGTNLGTTASRTTITFDVPGFCTRVEAYVAFLYVDASSGIRIAVFNKSDAGQLVITTASGYTIAQQTTVTLVTDSSQKVEAYETAASANTMDLNTVGWYLPNGM